MITRVRIEVSDKSREAVADKLLEAAMAIRAIDVQSGCQWEEGVVDIQSTRNGYWGYMVIQQKKALSVIP